MAIQNSTLTDIIENATAEDLDRIFAASRSRSKTLSSLRAVAVTLGSKARIVNLRPKYLIGLTGTVTRPSTRGRERFDLLLDEESIVRYKAGGGWNAQGNVVACIPAACLELL